MKLLVVSDESSKILGHRYLNSQISFYLGLLQLAVCFWAIAQHVYSILEYQKILYCDFENGTQPALLVGVDVIIFDIGLFHALWNIDSCVAQYLDGGYGRFLWCICHIFAFLFCLPFAFVARPRPACLWPLLIQQSAYGIGLLILSLAALPRVLPTFTSQPSSASIFCVLTYVTGASLNFFLLYIYWHWYWHIESMWNSARKLRDDRKVSLDATNRLKRKPFSHRFDAEMVPMSLASAHKASKANGQLNNSGGGGGNENRIELDSANPHRRSFGAENSSQKTSGNRRILPSQPYGSAILDGSHTVDSSRLWQELNLRKLGQLETEGYHRTIRQPLIKQKSVHSSFQSSSDHHLLRDSNELLHFVSAG